MTSMPYLICSVCSFVPAIVFHEASHAFAAYKMGDPTAKRAGRLSFNPLKHIDPFGTVVMPLLLLAMGMPVFGYAKPVPYNPAYFTDQRKGDLVVGLAGPASNLLMALAGAGLAYVLYLLLPVQHLVISSDFFYYFYFLFLPMFSLINLYLMFFNLLPIPPLDGSSIFAFLLPEKYLPQYYKVQRYALPIFMMLVLVLPSLVHINPIGAYLGCTAGKVFTMLYSFL